MARVSAFQAEGRRFESGLPLQPCSKHSSSTNNHFRFDMTATEEVDFTVELWRRESKKARSISIRSLPPYGVEIVVPKGLSHKTVTRIVKQNSQYINQKLCDIKNRNFDIKPSHIFIPATSEAINVIYCTPSMENSALTEANGTIILDDPKERVSLVTNSKLLQQWLQGKAVSILEKAVETISNKLNIPYNKIKIGSRKSIWGSCSYKKNINLNRNLVFLEPSLIDYVVTHELCHIHEMNHSKQFWSLLNESLPGSKKLQKQLKSDANKSIPSWALI